MATSERPSNVVSLRNTSLPPLAVATTASRGEFLRGSRSEVWLCQAYAGTQGLTLYVKPGLSVRSMMAEALAAQVGRCVGLPCPQPYLVTVAAVHVGRHGGRLVAFGSEQFGTKALVRRINEVETIVETLEKQRLLDRVCCFDELIANSVRQPSDILFDPLHGAALIDHEGAMEPSTGADQAVTNWLADRKLTAMSLGQRSVWLEKLRRCAQDVRQIAFGAAPSATQFHQEGLPVYVGLVEFLKARLVHLDALLSRRLLPEQAHLFPSTSADASSGTS